MSIQAVLWDMDGTLVDSEPVWWGIEIAVLNSLGADWTEADCRAHVGNSLPASLDAWMARLPDGVITREGLAHRMYGEITRSLKDGVRFQPGALELLVALTAEAVPCALVSASYRFMVDAVVSHCPPGAFEVTVAGDEVSRGKPDPESYLKAAGELGVDIERCVVLEDSPSGAAAGNAAGALVVAVPQFVPVPPAPRRVEVGSLVGMTPATLRGLLDPAGG